MREDGDNDHPEYNRVELDVGARHFHLNSLPDGADVDVALPRPPVTGRKTFTVRSDDKVTLQILSMDCKQQTTCDGSSCLAEQVMPGSGDSQLARVTFISASPHVGN